jgi:hypothetical protein
MLFSNYIIKKQKSKDMQRKIWVLYHRQNFTDDLTDVLLYDIILQINLRKGKL